MTLRLDDVFDRPTPRRPVRLVVSDVDVADAIALRTAARVLRRRGRRLAARALESIASNFTQEA